MERYLTTAICAYIIIGYLLAEGAYKAMKKAGRRYRGAAYVITIGFWPLLFLVNFVLWLFSSGKEKTV